MFKHFLSFAGLLLSIQVMAQKGIGTTTPHASAKLEVAANDKWFLTPRMTSTQRLAISNPTAGLFVYQTDGTSGLYYYGGSSWIYIINSYTNVLPMANGGTGVSTSTGSGNVVLSTSPTLETPTISSGNTQFPSSIVINSISYWNFTRLSVSLGNTIWIL